VLIHRRFANGENPGKKPLIRLPVKKIVVYDKRTIEIRYRLYTGLRLNEIRSLTVTDLDVENPGLRLDGAWTKNRKFGFQPLPPGAGQAA